MKNYPVKYVEWKVLDKQHAATFISYSSFFTHVSRLLEAKKDFNVSDREIDAETGKLIPLESK